MWRKEEREREFWRKFFNSEFSIELYKEMKYKDILHAKKVMKIFQILKANWAFNSSIN